MAIDSSGHHWTTKVITSWTVDDVCSWIEETIDSAFVDKFRSGLVNGKVLVSLTGEDLEQLLCVTNPLHRKRILEETKHLLAISTLTSTSPGNVDDVPSIDATSPRTLQSAKDKGASQMPTQTDSDAIPSIPNALADEESTRTTLNARADEESTRTTREMTTGDPTHADIQQLYFMMSTILEKLNELSVATASLQKSGTPESPVITPRRAGSNLRSIERVVQLSEQPADATLASTFVNAPDAGASRSASPGNPFGSRVSVVKTAPPAPIPKIPDIDLTSRPKARRSKAKSAIVSPLSRKSISKFSLTGPPSSPPSRDTASTTRAHEVKPSKMLPHIRRTQVLPAVEPKVTGDDRLAAAVEVSEDGMEEEVQSPSGRKRKLSEMKEPYVSEPVPLGDQKRHPTVMRRDSRMLDADLYGTQSVPFLIILPDSAGRTAWDAFMLLLVIYYALMVPLVLGFDTKLSEDPNWNLWEYISNSLFVIDICLNFRTAYKETTGPLKGFVVTDSRKIFLNYTQGWFWIDVLASLPMDIIFGSAAANKLLRVVRGFKVLRIVRASRILSRLQSSMSFNPALIRLFKLMLALGLLWHWMACCYWFICRIEGFEVDDDREGTPWTPPAYMEFEPLYNQYGQAFYWAVVVTTGVGRDVDPMTNLETTFTIIAIIIGVMMYAFIISSAASALQNIDDSHFEQQQQKDAVDRYMRAKKIPYELQKEINDYLDVYWEGFNEGEQKYFLHTLHPALRAELLLSVARKMTEKVPIFRGVSDACLLSLSTKLITRIYLPKEYVVVEGELGQEMYFIAHGQVEVLDKDMQRVVMLFDGDFFGERALLNPGLRRTASVRTVSHCELLILRKPEFEDLVRNYPVFSMNLERYNPMNRHARGWDRVRLAVGLAGMVRRMGGKTTVEELLYSPDLSDPNFALSLEQRSMLEKLKGGMKSVRNGLRGIPRNSRARAESSDSTTNFDEAENDFGESTPPITTLAVASGPPESVTDHRATQPGETSNGVAAIHNTGKDCDRSVKKGSDAAVTPPALSDGDDKGNNDDMREGVGNNGDDTCIASSGRNGKRSSTGGAQEEPSSPVDGVESGREGTLAAMESPRPAEGTQPSVPNLATTETNTLSLIRTHPGAVSEGSRRLLPRALPPLQHSPHSSSPPSPSPLSHRASLPITQSPRVHGPGALVSRNSLSATDIPRPSVLSISPHNSPRRFTAHSSDHFNVRHRAGGGSPTAHGARVGAQSPYTSRASVNLGPDNSERFWHRPEWRFARDEVEHFHPQDLS
eukprot:Rmarinus@m.27151